MQPLRLPNSDESAENYVQRTLEMASWGAYSNEYLLSDSLRVTSMEIISSNDCSKVYPPPLITPSVLCSRSSHCSGDSGSMLVDLSSSGEYVAVGLASFSFATCNELIESPSVFMRISSFVDFIRQNSDLTQNELNVPNTMNVRKSVT